MAHRSYTHKHTNQPEIQADTIKHKETEVYTDSYTRQKDRTRRKILTTLNLAHTGA